MRAMVAVPLLVLASCANPGKAPTTLVGDWGGQGIGMKLQGGIGEIEYDCAAGTVDEALPPAGPFSVKGTHRAGQPGPVRVGQIFTSQQATYSGTIAKNQMVLSVKLEDGTELGPFELAYGVPATINRCL